MFFSNKTGFFYNFLQKLIKLLLDAVILLTCLETEISFSFIFFEKPFGNFFFQPSISNWKIVKNAAKVSTFKKVSHFFKTLF